MTECNSSHSVNIVPDKEQFSPRANANPIYERGHRVGFAAQCYFDLLASFLRFWHNFANQSRRVYVWVANVVCNKLWHCVEQQSRVCTETVTGVAGGTRVITSVRWKDEHVVKVGSFLHDRKSKVTRLRLRNACYK